MYVVMGASGNTGHVIANSLLARGEKVRVIARNAAHLQPLAAKGAEPFVADADDANALTQAFQHAQSAYVLIPPNPASTDPRGYSDRIGDAIAAAVQNSGIENVVVLSSIGAEKTSGTGPVAGLHRLEEKLSQNKNANLLFLRAGYFMENTLPQVGAIQKMGFAVGPVRPDLKLPMIATRDIGAAAAEELLNLSFRGRQVRELQGQRDLSYSEVAATIGKAIGKPDLKYVQLNDDQVRGAMVEMGMSDQFARVLLEMTAALNSGEMRTLEPRTPQNTTPTSYDTFVADTLVPAYQHQAAA